ncbi:recombinase family protein [Sphingomonas sp.]|uniref:recombinase family protein n=1 Tax=Sphingomonas sp. TaxID=28214 RepID=UPI0025F88538|nr:recombinase family protein [Sphingomonas sp.]
MNAIPVASYLRVSTGRQAEEGLSILDQRNSIQKYVDEKGWLLVQEFEERGASGRTDQRPVFQAMIDQALQKPPPFRKLLVHSYSRFARDEMLFEWYGRKMRKNGVELVSITQDFGDGPAGDLTRRIMALTDELNSAETAKHVRRTMLENHRQGFWNGSAAPLGYRSVVAEMRGHKAKKKLEVDPEGAETIRLIFQLYLEGDGVNGPLGIKNTVRYLNDHGFKNAAGRTFQVSLVEKILKDEVYVGRAYYNVRDSQTRTIRPREEWICQSVPPIISEETFQRVQTKLALQAPANFAPRLVNGNPLLSGLVICGGCGSPMRRLTAKYGRFAYFRCGTRARTGSCPGGTTAGINEAQLDALVMEALLDRLLTAERVQTIIGEVSAARKSGAENATTTLARLKSQLTESSNKLARMMSALANGVVQPSETFKKTVQSIEAERTRVADLISAQERLVETEVRAVTLEEAAQLANVLRVKLEGSKPALKKRIVRSFVQQIIVGDEEIAIVGAKSDLCEVVTGGGKK